MTCVSWQFLSFPCPPIKVEKEPIKQPTSSRKTRKVTLEPSVAVSVPSLVTRWRPLGAWTGHCCLLAVYSMLTPAVQLLETTFL